MPAGIGDTLLKLEPPAEASKRRAGSAAWEPDMRESGVTVKLNVLYPFVFKCYQQ